MKEKPYKVHLREIHIQEIVVDAVSEADAIQKAIAGDGEYGNGTEYVDAMEDGHKAEEI